jgi:hypothetical protein
MDVQKANCSFDLVHVILTQHPGICDDIKIQARDRDMMFLLPARYQSHRRASWLAFRSRNRQTCSPWFSRLSLISGTGKVTRKSSSCTHNDVGELRFYVPFSRFPHPSFFTRCFDRIYTAGFPDHLRSAYQLNQEPR